MKKIAVLVSLLCFVFVGQLEAQIRDNRFKGVSVFSSNGYNGSETKCRGEGNTFTFPNGFSSVKVYGPWKLVHENGVIAIDEDDSYYTASTSGVWTLEKTSSKYYAIAYTGTNYNGKATFLKTGSTDFGSVRHKSVKTIFQAAKLGWYNTTGYQKCVSGNNATVDNDFTRIDVSLTYNKCASVGKPLRVN